VFVFNTRYALFLFLTYTSDQQFYISVVDDFSRILGKFPNIFTKSATTYSPTNLIPHHYCIKNHIYAPIRNYLENAQKKTCSALELKNKNIMLLA